MIRIHLHRTLTVLAVLVLTAATGYADSITYTFVGTGTAGTSPEPVAFQLTVPDYVNPALNGGFEDFTCGQLDASTNCLVGSPLATTFSNQSVLGAFSAQLTFSATNDAEYAFFFLTGAFDTPGTYTSETGLNDNEGTLTVSTPEPGSAILLVAGVLLLLTFRARLRDRKNSALV
jgi:hypothetical protein